MPTGPTCSTYFSYVRTARGTLLVLALAWSVGATAQLPGVSFVASRNYPVQQGPRAIAVGDFNSDGKPDLATVNSASSTASTVSVLINNRDGTYLPAVNYSVGSTPVAISIADFNGDGKLDIAVIDQSASSISVLLGNGDGTFQAQKTTSITTGNSPDSLAIGDFNGDGKLDVGVTVNLPQAGQRAVAVLLGNGDGTFQSPINYDSGSGAHNAIVADFNGDSKLDIAVTDSNANAISVLLGNGDGTFQTPANTPTTFAPGSIAAADFNRDSKVDVLLADTQADQNLYAFLGNGNGTFGAPVASKLLDTVISVSVGDLNGDGSPDVVALTQDFGLIACLGNGDGTFRPGTPFELSPNGHVPIIADLNGDGAEDLAAIDSGGVDVAFGNGDGTFQVASSLSTSTPPNVVLTSDINGDGKTDVVLLGGVSTGYATVLLGNGDGTFQAPTTSPSFGTGYNNVPGPAVVGVLNPSNAKPDLVLRLNIPGLTYIGVMIGNGDGTFQPLVQYSVGGGAPAIGDFTGDGIPDIIAADANGNLYLLKGNGDGTFGFAVTIPTNVTGSGLLAIGDFNNDRKLDVALAGAGVSILLGNGDGTFQPAKSSTLTSAASSIAVGRFNNDGNLDVVVQTQSQGAVLLGNGDGTLQPAVYFPTGGGSIAVGDLNNDGKPDLLMYGGGTVSVLLGNGDGTFQLPQIWGTNGFGESAAIGDFNGTGHPDIVAVPSVSNMNASLLVNRAVPAPRASFNPSGLTFAPSQVGITSTAQVIALTNTGNGPLTISSIAIAGTNASDFSQTNTCPTSPASLAAQANCQISVTFTPTGTGSRLASITIADNATTGQETLSLLGTATDFSIAAATGANCPTGGNCTTSAVITAGQTATYNLQVSPLAGFNGNVTLSCSGAPTPATCTVSPATVSSSSYAFTVSVSGTSGMQVFPSMDRPSAPRGRVRRFGVLVSVVFAIVLILAALALAQKNQRRLLLPALAALVLALLYACGGGGGTTSSGGGGGNTPPPQTPVNATITVTATSNSVNRTLPMSLTINP
jgi:hypothetical protein